MSLPYDPRSTKDSVGASALPRRILKDQLSELIVGNLALATASNYFSDQYGSNHRVIYESIAALYSDLVIDSLDLADDAEYSALRTEFLASKLTEILFQTDTIPATDTDTQLRNISVSALTALLNGSTEESVTTLLKSQDGVGLIEISRVSAHILSVLSSVLAYTGFSDYDGVTKHRHYCNTTEMGVGSTSAPLGHKWGDDLHTHKIIDGVVQPHTDGHTHTVEYGLPANVVRLQSNLSNLLRTTKPAHIKTGAVSSLLAEEISAPSESFYTYTEEDGAIESPFLFSLSLPYQEDMRRARGGTWENAVYGYASSNTFRVYRTISQVGDRLLTGTQVRRVLSYTTETPQDSEGLSWEFPRLGDTGTGYVENGYLFDDAASIFPYVEEGEIVLLNGVAYFCEPRASGYLYTSSVVFTLDSAGQDSGLLLGTYLDFPWVSSPLRYRYLQLEGNGTNEIEIRLQLKRSYRGMPILASDLVIEEGAPEVERFVANLNKIFFVNAVPDGAIINVGIPAGDGDFVSITGLNDTRFRLNIPRLGGQVETTASRGFYTDTEKRLSSLGRFTPSNVLWKSTLVEPYTEEVFTRRVEAMSSRTTNTPSMTINQNFRLNKVYAPSSTAPSNIRGYATKTLLNKTGSLLYSDLGFKPKFLISVQSAITDIEYEGTLTAREVLVPSAPLNHPLIVTAISENAYESGDWLKGEVFNEGQPSFDPSTALLENALSSLTAPTVEEVMDNPKGLIRREGGEDKIRGVIHRRTTKTRGKAGESIFYEDEVTALALSGFPFSTDTEAMLEPKLSRRPALVLNSEQTHIGFDSVLSRSRRVMTTDVFLEIIYIPFPSIESVEDILPAISDEASGLFGLSLLDSVSVADEEPILVLNPVISEPMPTISDEVMVGISKSMSDSVSDISDEGVATLRIIRSSVSDNVPLTSDAATPSLHIVYAAVEDSVPPVTEKLDFSSSELKAGDFSLYAGFVSNEFTATDNEKFIIYTSDDYFARRDLFAPTIFSGIPTPTVYADSTASNFLSASDLRRGFIKTLFDNYPNTTPPSANISWKVIENSTTDGEFMPDINYTILARSDFDDADEDLSATWKAANDGSDTFSVLGATPVYDELFPSTSAKTPNYYKHTLSVSSGGVVTFIPDTTPKQPTFLSTTRIYFYVQNIDGGLGNAVSAASSIRVLNGAGTSYITPTIHVPAEVSNVAGTATFNKTTINNINNIAQVSWLFTPLTNYRIVLDRDPVVDMRIFMQPRSGTGSAEYNTLYTAADTLDYRSFDDSKLGVMFYLQILEDGSVLITN